MTKLGTWTTFDCPSKNVSAAKNFLSTLEDKYTNALKEINPDLFINVRMVYNPHDFGPYPSFEIDCNINDHYGDDSEDPSYYRIIDLLNDMEEEYYKYAEELDE
jgi:hypothetical protein